MRSQGSGRTNRPTCAWGRHWLAVKRLSTSQSGSSGLVGSPLRAAMRSAEATRLCSNDRYSSWKPAPTDSHGSGRQAADREKRASMSSCSVRRYRPGPLRSNACRGAIGVCRPRAMVRSGSAKP